MGGDRYRRLFRSAGVGIALLTTEGEFVDVNPAYEELVGYTLEELRRVGIQALLHPEDPIDEEGYAALLAGDLPELTLRGRHVAKDGSTLFVRARITLIGAADGFSNLLCATVEDVTEQQMIETRFRRDHTVQRLAGHLARIGGWAVEATDGSVYWSEAVCRILEVPEDTEPDLATAMSLYPPGHREKLQDAIEECLTSGTGFDLDLEIRTFAGRTLAVRVLAEAHRDPDGRVNRIVGAFQDTTKIRATVLQAKDAVRRLTTTLESMTEAFVTLDHTWRFTFVNERAEQLFQRPREEILGRVIWDVFPGDIGDVTRAYREAMRSGQAQFLEAFHHRTWDRWMEVRVYPSDSGLAVYFQDVTESHLAVEALRRSEARLREQAALLDEAQDAITVRDLDGRITYWNRSAARIFGWTADEAIGADAIALLADDPADAQAAQQAATTTGRWAGDLLKRTKDGSLISVHSRWTLRQDDQNVPTAILVTDTDVTDKQLLERQLMRAQRLESIGTLAGGIAHDLNNILSPIVLASELLQREPAALGEKARLVDTIAMSARRGTDIVEQVLSFARGMDGLRLPVDIHELLDDLRAIVRDTFPKNIALELEVPPELPAVKGDSTQLQQVLLNLVVNARDAMPDGGRIRVAVTQGDIEPPNTFASKGAHPHSLLFLEVHDTGPGMSPEVAERIFEPFFTTKPHGSGTGLGLPTSKAIVESHDGFLWVDPQPGWGTRFFVALPTSQTPARPTVPTVHELPRGDGRTVLLVDDEDVLRDTARRTLEEHGYQVLEAADGVEAIARFTEHRGEVAIVVTDLQMPIMDGEAAARELRRLDPDVPILATGGVARQASSTTGRNSSDVNRFLPKPYTAAALLHAIDEVVTEDGHGTYP